jgi:hypothetical protein
MASIIQIMATVRPPVLLKVPPHDLSCKEGTGHVAQSMVQVVDHASAFMRPTMT